MRLTLSLKRIVTLVFVLIALAFAATACTSQGNAGDKATKREQAVQQNDYARLVAHQPAHTMDYSPTRRTINFWIDTWSKPGKLAYVYLQNANGDLIGYYTLVGPPVSMCTSQTPDYKIYDGSGNGGGGNLLLPAPGVDGVYYSGGECNTYYGEDATSHAFIEFTAGLGINVLLYDQPLPNHPNVPNLAPTK